MTEGEIWARDALRRLRGRRFTPAASAWVFAGMVFFTVGQRIALAVSTLGDQAGRARITSDG